MRFITDFADQAVVLPFALAVGLSLLAAGWRRGAAAWVIACSATLAIVLFGKLAVHACGGIFLSEQTHLRSPSGHTASAAVAYGGLVALFAPRQWRPHLLAVGTAAVVAAVIGASRIALRVHSYADVLVGAACGIVGAILLARLAGDRPPGIRRALRLPLAVAVVVVGIVFHGVHLHAEDRIHRFAHPVWPLTLCAGAQEQAVGQDAAVH